MLLAILICTTCLAHRRRNGAGVTIGPTRFGVRVVPCSKRRASHWSGEGTRSHLLRVSANPQRPARLEHNLLSSPSNESRVARYALRARAPCVRVAPRAHVRTSARPHVRTSARAHVRTIETERRSRPRAARTLTRSNVFTIHVMGPTSGVSKRTPGAHHICARRTVGCSAPAPRRPGGIALAGVDPKAAFLRDETARHGRAGRDVMVRPSAAAVGPLLDGPDARPAAESRTPGVFPSRGSFPAGLPRVIPPRAARSGVGVRMRFLLRRSSGCHRPFADSAHACCSRAQRSRSGGS
jgi:hypothetical protein